MQFAVNPKLSFSNCVVAWPFTPPLSTPVLPPPPLFLPHATQVAGGLGLSLTAANYRLTRPRCALHDCLAPRSGYPQPPRNSAQREVAAQDRARQRRGRADRPGTGGEQEG